MLEHHRLRRRAAPRSRARIRVACTGASLAVLAAGWLSALAQAPPATPREGAPAEAEAPDSNQGPTSAPAAAEAQTSAPGDEPTASAAGAADLVGNAERGRVGFTSQYKCYACHGYDAQTGERRLVPLRFTQDGFITFVMNSPLPQMPAFADASPQRLADIFAYLETIDVDAPAVEDVPLLKALQDAKLEALTQ